MQNVTVTKVYVNDKDRNGNPYTVKKGDNFGKPFFLVNIYTKEFPEEKLTGFFFRRPEFKEGDVIPVEITEDEYNGRISKKFKLAKGGESRPQTVTGPSIEDRVKRLEDNQKEIITHIELQKQRPEIDFDPKKEEGEVLDSYGFQGQKETEVDPYDEF